MSPVLPCLRTLNFGNLFSFLLGVFSVNFLTVFGSVMSRQAKENVCDAQSIPVRLHCPFENCQKSYNSKKHLNEHFRLHPSHKPHTLPSTRVRVTAKECAEKFLDDETNPYTRKLRVKALFQLLTDDELKQFALPRIANIVTPVDFLLQGASDINRVRQRLVQMKNELCSHHPELTSHFCHGPPLDEREQLAEIVQNNLPHSCDWIIEKGNGTMFKDFIMPKLCQAGFQGTLLEVLTTFCSGLDKVFRNLLPTPHELTGDEYGAQARVLLGFQAVQIFRSTSITASCKQIVTYVPYYIDKALADVTNSPLLWQTSVMQQWKLRTNRTKESPCFFLEEDLAQ